MIETVLLPGNRSMIVWPVSILRRNLMLCSDSTAQVGATLKRRR
jgi:hypothetical protein